MRQTPEVRQLCRLGEELCEAARDYLSGGSGPGRLCMAVKMWDEMMGDRFLFELSEGT